MADITLTFKITRNNLPAITANVRKELSGAVRTTAEAVLSAAKIEIDQGVKSGRIYRIGGETEVLFNAGETGDDGPNAKREKLVTFNKGKAGVAHQASAPGEAPATEVGNLVNSGAVIMEEGSLEAEVRFDTAYAAALEFGTMDMAARPYLGPALESAEPGFVAASKAAVAAGMAKGSKQ